MTDAEEARLSLQSSRLDQLANHMRKFDELFTIVFAAASPDDRSRLRSIMRPITDRFDPALISFEIQEWADESTKENA